MHMFIHTCIYIYMYVYIDAFTYIHTRPLYEIYMYNEVLGHPWVVLCTEDQGAKDG